MARVRRGMTKIDVVVTSARYDPARGRVSQAQVYERFGPVWSDILLFDRQELLARLEAGKKVVTGVPTGLPGEFDVRQTVRVREGGVLVANGGPDLRDDLGVPLY